MARQSIRGAEVFAQNMFECRVEFGEVEQPPCLLSVEVARFLEVGQVFMVSEDPDCSGGS